MRVAWMKSWIHFVQGSHTVAAWGRMNLLLFLANVGNVNRMQPFGDIARLPRQHVHTNLRILNMDLIMLAAPSFAALAFGMVSRLFVMDTSWSHQETAIHLKNTFAYTSWSRELASMMSLN